MSSKEFIDRSDFGFVFHTLFRKALDSEASSICWNAIMLLSEENWKGFLDKVYKYDKIDRAGCIAAIELRDNVSNILYAGLEILSDEEYQILDKYLRKGS